jgi:hypothetical protein
VLCYGRRDCHLKESLKSRLIVRTVVDIIVIIGVVAIAMSPRSARAPKAALDLVRSEAAEAEFQMHRFAVRTTDASRALALSGSRPS